MSTSSPHLRVIVFRRQQTLPTDAHASKHILKALEEAYPEEEIIEDEQSAIHLDSDRVEQLNFTTSIPQAPSILPRPVIVKLEDSLDADVIVHYSKTNPRTVKLAVFDMDSTLIQQEVIDVLASYAGVEQQVAEITSRAMNGELDFSGSLRERVSLLKGLPKDVFDRLKPRITLTPGADILLKVLKAQGTKTALLSGGFMPLATFIGQRLRIDHVHANELEVENGELTGKAAKDCIIVDAERKRELLLSIAEQEGVADQSDILAIGDGANDLLMLSQAGLGIAVNAKPRVQDLAPYKLNCQSLVDVLHVLGYTQQQITQSA